jgi:hypothetical protein
VEKKAKGGGGEVGRRKAAKKVFNWGRRHTSAENMEGFPDFRIPSPQLKVLRERSK